MTRKTDCWIDVSILCFLDKFLSSVTIGLTK